MEMLEPSPSLAHLQARQRLCWAALTHQRLGPSAGVLPQVGPLLARVGTVGAAVEPGQPPSAAEQQKNLRMQDSFTV